MAFDSHTVNNPPLGSGIPNAEMNMAEVVATSERIDSWKEISSYLGRDVSTVIRWEKERGLPVRRIPGGQRQAVFAYRHELDLWLAGSKSEKVEEQEENSSASSAVVVDLPVVAESLKSFSSDPSSAGRPRLRFVILALGVLFVLVAIALVAYWKLGRPFALDTLVPSDTRQLTADGLEKRGLQTDGKNLYFGEEHDGWFALAAMPIKGGQTRTLWAPQANVDPIALSPDGKKLLALTTVGVETDGELWVVPLDGNTPRRIVGITAHCAVWAPDNQTIVYGSGTKILSVSEVESQPHEMASFTALPFGFMWSTDGRRLRFVLEDVSTSRVTTVGQLSGDGMRTVTLLPAPVSPIEEHSNWRHFTGRDTYFVGGGAPEPAQTSILLVQYPRHFWEPSIQTSPLRLIPGNATGITYAPEYSKLFVLVEPDNRSEFVTLDYHNQSFRHVLPGVSGDYLDFSYDGEWIAYTTFPEGSFWISRVDGSAGQRIASSPEGVELPRWSPDGKQVAYMAKYPGKPWRIYVLDVATGVKREASEGNDSQGAPTWSPDGRSIAYGNVNCESMHACAIHRIDLATGKVHLLPDSDGLFTARWSPDGRFIAALHFENHQLFLFDIRTGSWRKLADSITGTDLGWSSDSKFLFANIRGTDARIVRIRLSDGNQETILDLKSQNRLNLAENNDLQFSVTPNNDLILYPRIHSQEIYAYDTQLP